MDLQRLQVVITAKTQELQKQISQVVNKLQDVNKVSNTVEGGFASMGKTGVKAMSDMIDATNDYYAAVKKVAQYNATYGFWGKSDQTQPYIKKLKDLQNELMKGVAKA